MILIQATGQQERGASAAVKAVPPALRLLAAAVTAGKPATLPAFGQAAYATAAIHGREALVRYPQ